MCALKPSPLSLLLKTLTCSANCCKHQIPLYSGWQQAIKPLELRQMWLTPERSQGPGCDVWGQLGLGPRCVFTSFSLTIQFWRWASLKGNYRLSNLLAPCLMWKTRLWQSDNFEIKQDSNCYWKKKLSKRIKDSAAMTSSQLPRLGRKSESKEAAGSGNLWHWGWPLLGKAIAEGKALTHPGGDMPPFLLGSTLLEASHWVLRASLLVSAMTSVPYSSASHISAISSSVPTIYLIPPTFLTICKASWPRKGWHTSKFLAHFVSNGKLSVICQNPHPKIWAMLKRWFIDSC